MTGIYALTIVMLIYAFGDVVSNLTKAKVPAGVVWGCTVLIGLWTGILPSNVFEFSQVGGFGMLAVTLMITMLGTTIDTPELKRQIGTIIVCLAGVIFSSTLIILVDRFIIRPEYAYVGAPVYAGGGAVALLLTAALKPRDMVEVVGFFTILGTAQGFFGMPVCSYFLRRYATEFFKNREEVEKMALLSENQDESGGLFKKKFLKIPDRFDKVSVRFLQIALVSSLAAFLASLTGGSIHAFVISLILGWFFTETGFFKKGMMQHIESAGLITFLASTVLFGNYVGVTPQMFLSYIGPIFAVMLTGILGTAVAGIVISKLVKMPVGLAIGLGLTCTFGFPMTMILTNNVCDAMAKDETERKALYNVLMPKMLVAGFVTVTIVSVFVGSFVLNTFFK